MGQLLPCTILQMYLLRIPPSKYACNSQFLGIQSKSCSDWTQPRPEQAEEYSYIPKLSKYVDCNYKNQILWWNFMKKFAVAISTDYH